MEYKNITAGTFKIRLNRFVAVVLVDGREERVHVKNTGRCRELLVPGATVYLEDHAGRMGSRRLQYSLIAVSKERAAGSLLVNMDSQAPNHAVREALESGALQLPDFGPAAVTRWEYKYGTSRMDFYLENEAGEKGLMEVKGVTLEDDGTARFPDAPTERGIKHLRELMEAAEERYWTGILFVIQMKGAHVFEPNDVTHRAFGDALREAASRGVHVLAYDCRITQESMELADPVPVKL